MINLFKHTSRSFFDFYNAFIAAYKNYPTFMFSEISAAFDFQSELMNRVATDILYPVTRESAYGFAAASDYSPVEADGSTVVVTATLSGSMDKTVLAGYQVGGISASGAMVIFEVIANTSVVASSTIDLSCKQQTSYTNKDIGKIENSDEFYELPLNGFTNIIKTSVSLLDSDTNSWTRVDNFDNSISTDRHFVLIYQSNGKSIVQFGDGVNGKKPTVNNTIFANFATTLGLNGRMEAGEININVGSDPDITVVTNALETSGGNNSESIASIIRNSRANARTRNIVWSQEDLETIGRSASSSVQKILGIPGSGAAIVHVIPSGGGLPSSGLKTIVEDAIIARTQFGVMPVTASDPNYLTQAITATITVRTGFTSGTVVNLTKWALGLITSAIDKQVIEYYIDNGIEAARTNVINVLWAYAFTDSENDALEFIINKWVELLGEGREFRQWGQALEVGDIWEMGNGLRDHGVDIFTLVSPLSNVATTSTQIIDSGTITVTAV